MHDRVMDDPGDQGPMTLVATADEMVDDDVLFEARQVVQGSLETENATQVLHTGIRALLSSRQGLQMSRQIE